MGDPRSTGSKRALKLVMAERKAMRLAGLLVLVALGLLVSDVVAGGGNDAHQPQVIEEIQEQGTPHEAVAEPAAPKQVVHKQERHHQVAASPARRTKTVTPKASAIKKHSSKEKAAHAKVMATAENHVKMSKKKTKASKAVTKVAKKSAQVVARKKVKVQRHRILGPHPKPVPHPHPLPGAPRGRTIRVKQHGGLPKHAKKVHRQEEEELVEEDEDEDEDEDELDRQEAEDEKAAAQEERKMEDEKAQADDEKLMQRAPKAQPRKRTKHEKKTLAMIQSLKVPKADKIKDVTPEDMLAQVAAKRIDAKKFNINQRAADNLNRIEEDNERRADQVELDAGVSEGGLEGFPHFFKKQHLSAFFKDHTWMIGAQESYGGYVARRRRATTVRAERSVSDFAASDNKLTSAMSLLSTRNQKRVLKDKSPSRYLQEDAEERGRDKPHYHQIITPHFRSMRGMYRAQSKYQRYKKWKRRQAWAKFNKLAGIGKNGFYDHDGDKSESDAASALLH